MISEKDRSHKRNGVKACSGQSCFVHGRTVLRTRIAFDVLNNIDVAGVNNFPQILDISPHSRPFHDYESGLAIAGALTGTQIQEMAGVASGRNRINDVLLILGQTTGHERFELLRTVNPRLPPDLTGEEAKQIVAETDSYCVARVNVINDKQRTPLTASEAILVVAGTSDYERYAIIRLIASRLGRGLKAQQVAALLDGLGNYYASGLTVVSERLTPFLSVDEGHILLSKTTGRDRYLVLRALATRLPRQLTGKDIAKLTADPGAYYAPGVAVLEQGP